MASFSTFALVVCVALLSVVTPSVFASVEVDQHTLHKLLGGQNHFFVQVVEHSWDRVKDWDDAAKEFLETPGVVVASLVTTEEENEGVDEKYGVTSYPSFLFFKKGETKPEVYTGAEDAEEAFDFLKSKLAPELHELHDLAARFSSASAAEQKQLLAKAHAVVEHMSSFKQNGELYVKTMQRVAEKGSDFVTKEQARLSALAQNDHTVEKQKKDFRKRLAVLKAFAHEAANLG